MVRRKLIALLSSALLSCVVLLLSQPLCAQDLDEDPARLPIELRAHALRVNSDGSFKLRLWFFPREDIRTQYKLRVGLDTWEEDLVISDHDLKPATNKWRTSHEVKVELELRVPIENRLEYGDKMLALVGLLDTATGVVHPLLDHEYAQDGMVYVAELPMPGFMGAQGTEQLEAIFAAAKAQKAQGDAPGAWDMLEEGLRRASDDLTKERFRDALLEVGRFPPAPQSKVEQGIVASRIRAEQIRYWRLIAGRMYDRGKLHGALRLLEVTGGSLAEQTDAAVIGALDDSKRVMRKLDDLREKLVSSLSNAQEAQTRKLIEQLGLTRALFDEAQKFAAGKSYPIAIELLRRLRRSDEEGMEDEARARRAELEEEFLAATPPAEEREVRAAIEHEAWARTSSIASHQFIFIGPEDLVQGIPADSKLAFDLAYIFITDLFGRVPNPQGDRVTVYFKELWDFGGGVGGGKIINIGNAQPHPKKPVRVDNGLLYHEFTHCTDDTRPVFAGFTEGLANMGAAYAFEALDQDSDALHSFEANLKAFERYFLERDIEYWRIQNYGPSAGFFLSFVDTYSKLGRARHDWSPLRKFFREYREAPVRDGREPHIARALAHFLMRAYGPEAFDDMLRFGFPLKPSDRRAVSLEMERFEAGEATWFRDRHEEFPDSPLPRDLVGAKMARAADWEDKGAQKLRKSLGIIFDWKVIGPFFTRAADPGACPFEPEWKIDLKKPVIALRSTKDGDTQLVWRDPVGIWERIADRSPVTIDAGGWMTFDYEPYGQRNAAIYALVHITLEEDADVMVHLRADDDFSLFLDDVRVGAYRGRGRNHSSSNGAWRGPFKLLPDGQRFLVHLEAGRHKVLVKIRNRTAKAGLVLAFSKPDGRTLDFEVDTDAPRARPTQAKASWKRIARLDSRSFKSKSSTSVGSFRGASKAFHGVSKDRGVDWRMFTVRPGFPKDSPSNLLWLKEKLTEDLEDLRIDMELRLERQAPKVLLTFQGEGGTDGLSGWNLILAPSGKSRVVARLERYDRLVYHTEPLEMSAPDEVRRLSVVLLGNELTVTLDELMIFDRVPVYPIIDWRDRALHRVGLATWGPQPEILSMEVSRAR